MRIRNLLTVLLVAATASQAYAERRNPLDGQPAIRHKVEMRKLRFEIMPQFTTSTNQDYRNAFGPGLVLKFHIFDWLAVGVSGNYTFNSNTPLEDRVRGQLPDERTGATYTYPGPQPTLQIHDQHVLNVSALAAAYVGITPFSGKFALFSSLFFRYDLFIDAGVGFVYYTQNNCCSHIEQHPNDQDIAKGITVSDPNTQSGAQFAGFKVGGMVGVGVHIFFTDWIGLELDLRDYIVKANPGGLDVNGDRILNSDDEGPQNNLFFGVGLTIMLPPKAKISR